MADPRPKPEITDPHLAVALDSFHTTFEASQKTPKAHGRRDRCRPTKCRLRRLPDA
jgi:hypothetical protein